VKRFLLLWVCLALALTVVTVLVSLLIFHKIDVRYQSFLELALIPTFQAAVVAWLTSTFGFAGIMRAVRETLGLRLAVLVLALNVAVLVVGWVARTEPHIGLVGAAGVHLRWAGVQTLAAAMLVLVAVPRFRSRKEQAWLWLGAACLLVVGSNAFSPWLHRLEALVPARFPTVLNWTLVYGATLVVVMILVLGVGGVLAHRSDLAGFHVDVAVAAGFFVALVVAASFFLHPYLLEPWASVVRTALSMAAGFMLIGAGLGWSAVRRPEGSGDRPAI